MTYEELISNGRKMTSFQREFVDAFLGAGLEQRLWRLEWPVGAGRMFAIAHVVQEVLQAQPDARILVVFGHQLLLRQFLERAMSMEISCVAMDRYRYRVMEDATVTGKLMWPRGHAYLLEQPFATMDDIVESVCAVNWELLITISCDAILGAGQLVERLLSSSPSVRVLSESAVKADLQNIGGNSWTVARLSSDEFAKLSGSRMAPNISPSLNIIRTQLTPSEKELVESVGAIIDMVDDLKPGNVAASRDLVARFESSPIAFEETARGLRNYLAHGIPTSWSATERELKDAEVGMAQIASKGDAHGAHLLLLGLTDYLRRIEDLSMDSKLNALLFNLEREGRGGDKPSRICIYSSYAATLYYLKAALEEAGIPVYLLLDSVSDSERQQAIANFSSHGGVLLGSTLLLIAGGDFGLVDMLVLYDLPGTSNMLSQLYGRFQRIGRGKPLKIIAFDPLDTMGFEAIPVTERINQAIQREG